MPPRIDIDRRSNRSQTSLTLGDVRPFLLVTSLLYGLSFFLLFVEPARVSLACHGGTCLLTRSSLATSASSASSASSMFGRFPNIASLVSPRGVERFPSSSLRDVVVSERTSGSGGGGGEGESSESSSTWDVELVLLSDAEGEDEYGHQQRGVTRHFHTFGSRREAEDVAITIEAAVRHSHLVRYGTSRSSLSRNQRATTATSGGDDGDNHGLALYVQVDASWVDELLLVVCLGLATYLSVFVPHSEKIVVNHDVGIVSIERFTLLTSLMALVDGLLHRRSRPSSVRDWGLDGSGGGTGTGNVTVHWSHIVLLAPASAVRRVEPCHSTWSDNRGRVHQKYGLRLVMRDRPDVDLVCARTSNRARHEDQLYAVRSVIREAQDGAERSRRLAEERRGRGIAETAAARANANDNDDGDSSSAADAVSGGEGGGDGGVGGGGVPGKECVICLERPGRVAFGPCAHVCCCEVCGQNPRLTRCPICRGHIAHRIGLFFS